MTGPAVDAALIQSAKDKLLLASAKAKLAGRADPNAKLHADFTSGALQRRTAILNKNDRGAANESNPSYLDRLGTVVERGASELGGGTLLRAERAALTGEDWDTAGTNVAKDVEEAGQNEPGVNIPKGVPLIGGARVTLPDLMLGAVGPRALMRAGAGPVAAAGLAAGVPTALAPQPEGTLARALNTMKATALGSALPMAAKVGEAVPMVRAAVASAKAPTLDENVVARLGAKNVSRGVRGAESDPLYAAFRAQPSLPETPELQALFENPTVKLALKQAQKGDLAGLPRTHPEVLVEVDKNLGSKAWQRVNAKRAGTGPIGQTASSFRAAVDDAADQAGGTKLSPAVAKFAEHSSNAEAVKRGARAMQYSASGTGAPEGAATTTSPAAFRTWQADARRTPDQLQAAREGVLARLKVEPKTVKLGGAIPVLKDLPIKPSQALRAAPDLLNPNRGTSPFQRAVQAFTKDGSPTPKEWWRARKPSADDQP